MEGQDLHWRTVTVPVRRSAAAACRMVMACFLMLLPGGQFADWQARNAHRTTLRLAADMAAAWAGDLADHDELLRSVMADIPPDQLAEYQHTDCRKIEARAMAQDFMVVFVAAADGRIVCRSPTLVISLHTVGDADFFTAAQADKVGLPVFGRSEPMVELDGAPSVVISRGLHDASGRFIGVIATTVPFTSLQQILATANARLQASASVFLVHDDGQELENVFRSGTQGPTEKDLVAEHVTQAPSGYFIDARENGGRLHVFYRIGGGPLVLDVSTSAGG